MAWYASPKWHLFVNRPTPLLKREFLKQTYFYVDTVSDLKITRLLVIGSAENNQLFVSAVEDRRCERKATGDYENNKAEKILRGFCEVMDRFHSNKGRAVEKALDAFKKVGAILIYTFYLERALDKASANSLSADGKERLSRLVILNSYLRDKGAKIIYGHFDKARDCLKKTHPCSDIDYCTLSELISDGVAEPTKIDERKKFFVMLASKAVSNIYTGAQARNVLRAEGFVRQKIIIHKVVKGLPAYRGRVTGEVVYIRNINDFKIKNVAGKILVAADTIIEYIPYLKKIKAIVTDGGGLTSHPAIVGRELKIPCVVSAKNATKSFKDGDIVEVDANKGIIKVIQKI